ncbi:MAG: PAS domain S-box protein [Candidatus Hermodarchaeota archaeon]
MKVKSESFDLLCPSNELYKNIIDNLMDLIIVLDLKGKFLYVSPQIYEISGYEAEELIGKSGFKFMHPDDISKAAITLKEGVEQKKKVYIEYRTIHKDGYYLDVAASGRVVEMSGKKRVFAIVRNISEQKGVEQKLRESEEKFRNITEQSFMGIAVIQDGVYKYFNERITEVNGYSMDDIKNWKPNEFAKIIHPDDREFVMEQAAKKQAGNTDVVNHYQFRIIRKDKKVRWLEIFSKTIYYEGRPADLVMTVDITEKIEAEQKLRESEEKFRTIAEQSFMGVLIIQEDKVEYVNKALLDIFEFSENDIENWSKQDLIKLIEPNDLQYLREYRSKLRQGVLNAKSYYSYQVYTKSGKGKWIDQFSKEINFKGKPAELVTIMDITEKKEAVQELVKLNSLKSELLRRTSHELKTPLVSIKGYADLLLSVHKENLHDYVLSSIVEIKQGCERLESLIQDILNTAELESGAIQLKKVEEDLSFFIKLSVRELQGLARLRNHKINLKIEDKMITSFEPEQIHRVISNLINNAIKYTPPNGEIEINSEFHDGNVVISVKDNGIGVTKEEKERLFTQFGKIERYGQGLDIISEGSGLGLFISKKIIELHGGKIWVESQGRNKGSTFYFTLPLIPNVNE